jgi:hypothetical protein
VLTTHSYCVGSVVVRRDRDESWSSAYNAFCDGQPSRIEPPLEIRSRISPVGSAAGCAGRVLDAQLSYWRTQWPAVGPRVADRSSSVGRAFVSVAPMFLWSSHDR